MNYRRACVFDQQENEYLVVSTDPASGDLDEVYDNERGLILVVHDIKTLYPWNSVVWAEVL